MFSPHLYKKFRIGHTSNSFEGRTLFRVLFSSYDHGLFMYYKTVLYLQYLLRYDKRTKCHKDQVIPIWKCSPGWSCQHLDKVGWHRIHKNWIPGWDGEAQAGDTNYIPLFLSHSVCQDRWRISCFNFLLVSLLVKFLADVFHYAFENIVNNRDSFGHSSYLN